MRTSFALRNARPVHVGVGATMLAIPATAVALTAGQADAQSAIQIALSHNHVVYGHDVVVSGNATTAAGGQRLQLQFAPAGSAVWRSLGLTRARANGSFRFRAPVRRSGAVRVLAAGAPPREAAAAADGPAIGPSDPRPVSVIAHFNVPAGSLAVTGGTVAHVRGRLLPGVAGRRVRLLTHSSHGWRTLATRRTGRRGGFSLPVRPGGSGRRWLRVSFAGDRRNTATWAHAGNVTTFAPSVASWYSDGGATACGFHAFYGVANRSLPCGTRVTFRRGGRSVNAVVDDRGPFVSGREWDLNQNTAAALGFGGVGVVWSSM